MLLYINEINSRVFQTHGNLHLILHRILVVFLNKAVSLYGSEGNGLKSCRFKIERRNDQGRHLKSEQLISLFCAIDVLKF
jgi:hypothetical protein